MSAMLSRTSPTRGGSCRGAQPRAQEAIQRLDQRQQIDAPAVGHVQHAAGRRRGVGGQEIGLRPRCRRSRSPATAAVAVNQRPPPGQHRRDEQGNDRRIGAVRVLPRPVNVEVPQGDGLEPVGRRERLTVEFRGEFRGGVGRDRRRQVGFAFARRGPVAVGGAGGGVDHPPHPGGGAASNKTTRSRHPAACDVQRPLDAQRHGGQGGLVKDRNRRLRPPRGAAAASRMSPSMNSIRLAEALDVRQASGAEVVQHADAVAAGGQGLGDVGTDEARPARNQECSHEKALTWGLSQFRAPSEAWSDENGTVPFCSNDKPHFARTFEQPVKCGRRGKLSGVPRASPRAGSSAGPSARALLWF